MKKEIKMDSKLSELVPRWNSFSSTKSNGNEGQTLKIHPPTQETTLGA